MDFEPGVLLITLVVVASGCIGGSNQAAPEPESPEVDSSGANNTIVSTGSSFEPRTITIQKGETVTWVNNADTSMWVATNNHPTHTLYDGTSTNQHCSGKTQTFDQCERGNRYSFTFEKEGEWRYHNHVGAGTGTVVVE